MDRMTPVEVPAWVLMDLIAVAMTSPLRGYAQREALGVACMALNETRKPVREGVVQ